MNYYSLNRKEKKSLRRNYLKTKKGVELNKILSRLIVEGLLCLFLGIYFLVSTIINNGEWWYYFLAGALFIAAIAFLVGQWRIKVKEYNKFLVKGEK
ncbi:MAG: hypothetical protein IJ475_03375 [Bacilli bacterium]|nr:hypothetical protein [Bacilli bacterium]